MLTQLERRDPTQEDEETTEGDEKAGSASEDEDESSESDSKDEEDDSEDEEAHRVARIEASDGSDAEEEGSESEDDTMGGDQMMALDAHLTEIFRSRVNEKGKGDAGAQREATHFKNQEAARKPIHCGIPCCPHTSYYGIGIGRKTTSDKVKAVLRARFGKAKEVPITADVDTVGKYLQRLHNLARKAHASDDLLKCQPKCGWDVGDDILQYAPKAVNDYRKCQASQLVQPVFTQLVVKPDNQSLIGFATEFREVVLEMITEAWDNTNSFNAAQAKEFLKLSLLGIQNVLLRTKLRSSRFQTSTPLYGVFNETLATLDWKNDGGEDAIMKDATKDKKRKAGDGKEDEERKKAKRKKVKSKGSKDN
ncbi:hypothetical protein M422DRAFT_70184 [Sphaerobolus stellatus SS14]|uniref:Unplaced genomic scaffold SPHSTscaffold_122, whole genome shotgun sequence n=1 Tax=Sphaerobolus stellatus (strain SS14) TaxID=990650 RepID=A0A0C9VBK3_SPHS4|nr:hypothetical protein M422DRAFT_70184 [Sphaerobolus stellatus SS14]